jgi:hypothetical protein
MLVVLRCRGCKAEQSKNEGAFSDKRVEKERGKTGWWRVCLCWYRAVRRRVEYAASSKQAGRQAGQSSKRARQGMNGSCGSTIARVCTTTLPGMVMVMQMSVYSSLSRPITISLSICHTLCSSHAFCPRSPPSPHTGWLLFVGFGLALRARGSRAKGLVASCARDKQPRQPRVDRVSTLSVPQWSRQSLVEAGGLTSTESDTGTPRQKNSSAS